MQGKSEPPQECVDHHIFLSTDGVWHLWACIRNTAVGRLLYHWESPSLEGEHWHETGEIMRADGSAGESLDDWSGQEWIQAPFVVTHGGTFYLFYGGHGTGICENGTPARMTNGVINPAMDCQMCLMTSPDGRRWTRHDNGLGQSRLFLGPGEVRDPCLLQIGEIWYLYYAGYHHSDKSACGVYLRTSINLLDWSPWELVHLDNSPRFGGGRWSCECPHVVERGGLYYLFRTEDYAQAKTHVFVSDSPRDFGVDNAESYYLCTIAVAAPEIIIDEQGREFITSNHDLIGGARIFSLKWE